MKITHPDFPQNQQNKDEKIYGVRSIGDFYFLRDA